MLEAINRVCSTRQNNHKNSTDRIRSVSWHQTGNISNESWNWEDGIRNRGDIGVSAFDKFHQKIATAIFLRRADPLRSHLVEIFVKRIDVSRQYEPDRTLFPGSILAPRPETYYIPVRRGATTEAGGDAPEPGLWNIRNLS